jgi:hypothetical protein
MLESGATFFVVHFLIFVSFPLIPGCQVRELGGGTRQAQ